MILKKKVVTIPITPSALRHGSGSSQKNPLDDEEEKEVVHKRCLPFCHLLIFLIFQ